MNLDTSINFLLENAGPVIQYRLRKEILKDISEKEENKLLKDIYQTPYYQLLLKYVKPNGYIGIGMHSWDKFKETPLQDGEAAARLLSYYGIPKTNDVVSNFAKALNDNSIIEKEFSYYNPEKVRFINRNIGIKCGFSLQLLIDTCIALIGYGKSNIEKTIAISFEAFTSLLKINSIDEITKFNPKLKRKNNNPYVESDTFLPCVYHLQILSHTETWRTIENKALLAKAINHQCKIMNDNTIVQAKIGNTYYAPLWALVRPLRPYETGRKDICYRRVLTDIIKAGLGTEVDIIKTSVQNLEKDLQRDGILKMPFKNNYEKRYFKLNHQWPGPYSEVALEIDHKNDIKLWCELTFWAVQFLTLATPRFIEKEK
ncbi:hypothetical protein FACS189493_5500 [Spirochaetia bacterium]|nr:hypothetical protein FACS189493_5500 [Spirochaetia bacterium]